MKNKIDRKSWCQPNVDWRGAVIELMMMIMMTFQVESWKNHRLIEQTDMRKTMLILIGLFMQG